MWETQEITNLSKKAKKYQNKVSTDEDKIT